MYHSKLQTNMMIRNPTVQIPQWDPSDDLTAGVSSPLFNGGCGGGNAGDYSRYLDSLTALHRYLPSNKVTESLSEDEQDSFSSDNFRMYEFKVRKCPRGRSHDWTECPYAHPGEKARRRDPRRFHYSGTPCVDFRKGGCKKGDTCEFAHGVFECWLHPSRYRTQPCRDGLNCIRRVCFFAHTSDQLRVLPYQTQMQFVTSPTSILSSPPQSPPSDSPPMSPSSGMNELVHSMRRMNVGPRGFRFGSPRGSMLRPGYSSSPIRSEPGLRLGGCEEEPVMERVESGRDVRAKMYEKLTKEALLGRVDSIAPDLEWISELVE